MFSIFSSKKADSDEEGEGGDKFDESGSDSDASEASTATTASAASAASSASSTSKKPATGRMARKKVGFYGVTRGAQKKFQMKNMMKSRRVIAAETIQKYVRGFLWRRAEERRQEKLARIEKERNIRMMRRRQMERDYWWDADVDSDELHRYQIEDLLMRLGLATSGTREQLLVRFKRWILHRSIVADIAVQCASVAVDRALNGSGGAYTLDVPTPSRRYPIKKP